MSTPFLKRKTWGIRHDELLAFIGFYIFFAVFYHVTLYINRMGFNDAEDQVLSFMSFMDDSGLDYLLKFLLTIPMWYLIFRKLKRGSSH